ncbi:response regulator [Polyangium jinanense]|uniref:Response regulator n=1 Tax=Polyangium jinanense TaxID=2829994 RepID=A0A9X3XAK2_9BACT|nr:response regulator [Polyangium jinanense]MDC3959311.1 response regulator [Polyangium jinanense]MDC3985720.1 response regulator [Polyangium jinanense]
MTFARDLVRAGSPKAAAAPSIQEPPPSTRMPGENILRPIRVLAVDDDPAFGKFAAKAAELALKGRSVRIRVARSGQDALDAARDEPPDLVLLDLDMPDLDGVDTLSHLRALPRGDHARVVVLSGRVGPQERWKFAVLGVREFVAKPIDLRRLVDTIDGIVERASWGAAPTA